MCSFWFLQFFLKFFLLCFSLTLGKQTYARKWHGLWSTSKCCQKLCANTDTYPKSCSYWYSLFHFRFKILLQIISWLMKWQHGVLSNFIMAWYKRAPSTATTRMCQPLMPCLVGSRFWPLWPLLVWSHLHKTEFISGVSESQNPSN